MVEKAKDPKKGSITEEDTATLLQRYTATTLLTLLHEVALSPEVRIDWNRLVAKTSTGISNAREYQMLWRHLAYREPLLDNFDDGARPLDYGSDLEYEVEAFPTASGGVSSEAAACVKVLIASGLPGDSSHQNGATVDASLTINIPNAQSSRAHENPQPTSSGKTKNITVPFSVQKQPLPTATTSVVATSKGDDLASINMAFRKKRKHWSKAEDLELIAAVQKCGEGNWANVLRADFKLDRTAAQLSQRWKNLKKRKQDLIVRGNLSGKLSEAQLATRQSLSIALDMPNRKANKIAETKAHSKFCGTNATSKPALTTATQAELQSQQDLNPTKPYQMGLLGSKTKSLVISKNTLTKPNDTVKAIADAAGARITSPLDTASLLRASQAKNAVHIRPTGGPSIQLSLPGGMSTHSVPHPNLSYMRTGLAAPPLSTPLPTPVIPSATHPGPSKALHPTSQHTPTNAIVLSEQIKGVSCSLDAELPPKQEVGDAEGSIVAELGCAPTEQAQDGAVISSNVQGEQVQVDKVDSPDQKAELKILAANAENPVGSLSMEKHETDKKSVISVQAEQTQRAKDNDILCLLVSIGGGDPSAVEFCEYQSTSEKEADLRSIVTDGCNGKQVLSNEAAGIKI